MRIIVVLAILAVTVLSVPVLAADAKAGEAVYTKACKTCHGADGSGNPAIAKAMKVTLPDLASTSDDSIRDAVVKGKGKMKPVASVTEKDIPNLIAYIHTLKK